MLKVVIPFSAEDFGDEVDANRLEFTDSLDEAGHTWSYERVYNDIIVTVRSDDAERLVAACFIYHALFHGGAKSFLREDALEAIREE